MSVINVEHISKLYGDRMVLDDMTCSVDFGDKIGIVGVNGVGKSTLLRMLAGDETPDEGAIIISKGLTMEWLPQLPDFPEDGDLISYVCEGSEEDYAFLSEAKSMLSVFEFDELSCRLATLSGGQKKRAALCKVLLHKADILILDEPTNHLDNRMTDWLERYLIGYKGILIMVTHDRYFLDQVTNRLWEIEKGQVSRYETNYSGYLEQKAKKEELAAAAEKKRQSLLRTELAWVRRGAKARTTKQKARLERYERLKRMDSPQGARMVEMESVGTRMGKKTVELTDLSKGYGGRTLFSGFTYVFRRLERIGFVGPNGCGKSTLMRLLAGLEDPDGGRIEWGDTIKIGYFAQECEVMDERQRVIDYIREAADYIRTSSGLVSASRMLERFLFRPDMQYTPIAKISGGERRRLYLLRVLMTAPNVLILDEPSNDLDIATLQVLEEFLDSFLGIVIVVSHDRYFLDRVVDRIAAFEQGRIVCYEGGYSDYLEKRKRDGVREADIRHSAGSSAIHRKKERAPKDPPANAGEQADQKSGAKRWKERKRSQPAKLKFTYQEQKEFETIDEDIEALETELKTVNAEIERHATDFAALSEWAAKREELEAALEEKTDRWVYLTDLAERIALQKNKPHPLSASGPDGSE